MKKQSKTDPKGSNYILMLNFVQQLLASPMSHSGHDPSNQYHQNPHENTLIKLLLKSPMISGKIVPIKDNSIKVHLHRQLQGATSLIRFRMEARPQFQ